MARVSRPDTGNLNRLRQTLREHFNGSPLATIGQQINFQLGTFEEMLDWKGLDQRSQREFFRRIGDLLHIIPAATRLSTRFWFDIHMIRAAADEWSAPDPLLPGSILPRAASEWHYAGIHIPNFTPNKMPRIDIIGFPGSDDPAGIDLLAYPWLYHELGHLLLVKHGRAFLRVVDDLLSEIIRQRARQRLGKAPSVQDRSRRLQGELDRAWRPSV